MKEGKEESKGKRKQGGCEDMRYVRMRSLGECTIKAIIVLIKIKSHHSPIWCAGQHGGGATIRLYNIAHTLAIQVHARTH